MPFGTSIIAGGQTDSRKDGKKENREMREREKATSIYGTVYRSNDIFHPNSNTTLDPIY
jgi:hypothetical protein